MMRIVDSAVEDMILARSPAEMIERRFEFRGKAVADIGCGTGDFVRRMTKLGAKVIGVDTAEMIARAEQNPRAGGESYQIGTAQDMVFEPESLDLLTYVASFHHVPAGDMRGALERCHRVLKRGGAAAFIEPIGREGSYFEIIRLIEDEREIQALAQKAIIAAASLGFSMIHENFFYVERSLEDYAVLVDLFVDDPARRVQILEKAKSITENLARDSGSDRSSYRYRSICRLNILQKMAPRRRNPRQKKLGRTKGGIS